MVITADSDSSNLSSNLGGNYFHLQRPKRRFVRSLEACTHAREATLQLVKGGNSGAPSGHHRPHQRGTRRCHPVVETGEQDESCIPTTPSPTPEPNTTAAAPLSNTSAGPTAIPCEAGGDANGEMGSRTTEPPTSLQRQHSGAAPIYLEHNCVAEERPILIRDGNSLPEHSVRPTLPSATRPPHRRGHGDGLCLSHRGPGWSGGRTQYLPIPGPLSLGWVRGGTPN